MLLGRIDGLDPALFAIGNIAPDSGIPDENWEKFTPDPVVTHFKRGGDGEYTLADLEFFRSYLAPLRARARGADFSLRLGYWFHLLTDNLWVRETWKPAHVRYAAQFAADEKFGWTLKDDWYGLDFRYVREHPDCLFWRVFLRAACADSGLDFMPQEALDQRIAYIQSYYQDTGAEVEALVNRPFIYLSQAQMDRFIARTADTLARAFAELWVAQRDDPAAISALEIIAYRPVSLLDA
jgi:hypothetical protein